MQYAFIIIFLKKNSVNCFDNGIAVLTCHTFNDGYPIISHWFTDLKVDAGMDVSCSCKCSETSQSLTQ